MQSEKMGILKIGITGSAGSGKSIVLNAFGDLGLVTLDCDRIARDLVAPDGRGYEDVVALFGYDVVLEDRNLDRGKMRERILEKPELRKSLESILHPLIVETLFQRMESAEYEKERACVAEVPLLFELGMGLRFDATVVVRTGEEELVRRISLRDGVGKESARKMLALQMSQEEKVRQSDYVIENRGSLGELVESVGDLYSKIKKEFLTRKK